MQKKHNKKIFLILSCCFVFLLSTFYFLLSTASAYTFLEPLPQVSGGRVSCIDEANCQDPYFVGPVQPGVSTGVSVTFTDYARYIFNFALAAAAFLAVVQITIAGAQWIVSGASESVLGNAKGRIKDAIYGLILAFGSYLILYTVNPDLVTMSLNIPAVSLNLPPITTGTCEEIVTSPGRYWCMVDTPAPRHPYGSTYSSLRSCQQGCEGQAPTQQFTYHWQDGDDCSAVAPTGSWSQVFGDGHAECGTPKPAYSVCCKQAPVAPPPPPPPPPVTYTYNWKGVVACALVTPAGDWEDESDTTKCPGAPLSGEICCRKQN